MSAYERMHLLICEKCEKNFFTDATAFTVVNLDAAGSISDDFRNEKLNLVKCPLCNTTFVSEMHFLAYSLKQGFAVLALPSAQDSCYIHGKPEIYEFFNMDIPKLRLVNYQSEVLEKVRIFETGLDDYIIENIKYKFIDKKYFEDKTENILLFKEMTDTSLVFEYTTFLGKVNEVFEIPKDEYNSSLTFEEVKLTDKRKNIWHRVDINYFKERENAKET